MPSPSAANTAAALAERRNHEMIAERHADRIFQVFVFFFITYIEVCWWKKKNSLKKRVESCKIGQTCYLFSGWRISTSPCSVLLFKLVLSTKHLSFARTNFTIRSWITNHRSLNTCWNLGPLMNYNHYHLTSRCIHGIINGLFKQSLPS